MARNQSVNKRSRRMNILRPSDKTSGDGSSSDDLTNDTHSLFELHSLTNRRYMYVSLYRAFIVLYNIFSTGSVFSYYSF